MARADFLYSSSGKSWTPKIHLKVIALKVILTEKNKSISFGFCSHQKTLITPVTP